MEAMAASDVHADKGKSVGITLPITGGARNFEWTAERDAVLWIGLLLCESVMTDDQLQAAIKLRDKRDRLKSQLDVLTTHLGNPAFLDQFRGMWYVPESIMQGLRTQLRVHFEEEMKRAGEELERM
jgi:hypothetical protein